MICITCWHPNHCLFQLNILVLVKDYTIWDSAFFRVLFAILVVNVGILVQRCALSGSVRDVIVGIKVAYANFLRG